MSRLTERYVFDWERIKNSDGYHIEYCITDICNKNCAACSHLAPLAKSPAFVTEEEFVRVLRTLKKCVPDAHTFWLTGGEPTLHPQFLKLAKIARGVYKDSFVGIYSNGINLKKYEADGTFWEFVRENGIVWGITCYGEEARYFEDMFSGNGCLNNLAIVQSGKIFFNLTNYSCNQPITDEKYKKCGWEKSKINVRNGKIYNCPSAEFADLFNGYFGNKLRICELDYLVADESLTAERLVDFRGPVPFCGQCDLNKRYKKIFAKKKSRKKISEWSEF